MLLRLLNLPSYSKESFFNKKRAMSSIGKLYGDKDNLRVQKVLITSHLSGVKIDFDGSFNSVVDSKTPAYLEKFPLGQIPAFESKEGLLLTESNAIVFHIAGKQQGTTLLGKSPDELSKIMQLSFFVESQLSPYGLQLMSPFFDNAPYDKSCEEYAFAKMSKSYSFINDQIQSKSHFVGDSITIADIIIFGAIYYPFVYFFGNEDRKLYPNLDRWIQEINQAPGFEKFLAPIHFSKERLVYGGTEQHFST